MAETLATTRNKLLDELDRTGQLTSQAHRYINEAVEFYKKDAFAFNEELATSHTTANNEYLALPIDWGEEYTISLDATGNGDYYPLNYRTYEEMEMLYIAAGQYTGIPIDYTIFREQIRLGPIPDSSYPVKMAYRVEPATATAEAQTNIFLTRANHLIKSRAGKFMSKHVLKDKDKSNSYAVDEMEALAKLRGLTTRYQMRGYAKARR